MVTDKKTIGLTSDNRKIMNELWEKDVFNDQMDLAKFAMSVAINQGVIPNNSSEGTETIWNVGSFDPEGEIKSVIKALYPDTVTPYRAMEYLFNQGFHIISEKMNENNFEISDLLDMNK